MRISVIKHVMTTLDILRSVLAHVLCCNGSFYIPLTPLSVRLYGYNTIIVKVYDQYVVFRTHQ